MLRVAILLIYIFIGSFIRSTIDNGPVSNHACTNLVKLKPEERSSLEVPEGEACSRQTLVRLRPGLLNQGQVAGGQRSVSGCPGPSRVPTLNN